MKFHVITLLPNMIEAFFDKNIGGVVGAAKDKNLFQLNLIPLRDYSDNKYKSVDDRPFGGGDGMVLTATPLQKALQEIPADGDSASSQRRVIYLSPQGRLWNQKLAQEYSQKYTDLILICGRYGGVDQRFLNQYVDEEISIGDYVLSGGEIAAVAMMDSMVRCLPGVLGHHDSCREDSFRGGDIDTEDSAFVGVFESPLFTRPTEILQQKVPQVLTSGDHHKVALWKRHLSLLVTLSKRPELLNVEKSSELLEQAIEYAKTLPDQEWAVLGFKQSVKDLENKWILLKRLQSSKDWK
jgi:tRNA (guanine37-N1)-methyltransferase